MLVQKIFRSTKQMTFVHRFLVYQISRSSLKGAKEWILRRRLLFGTPFSVMGIWGLSKAKDQGEGIAKREFILSRADALFDQGKYQELYEFLKQYQDNKDVDILWRMCRALYNMSKLTDEGKAKPMIYEAYDLISTALQMKEDHWAVHKWMSILLDSKSSYEGMKAKIRELNNVKQHMQRAIELNPKDATTFYMLGTWCYQVSDLAWYQRKIAAAVFGEPPKSSFEEALQYFENAEKVDPKFYSHNLLMLGKTYLKLNRKEDALKFLKILAEYPAKNDDDQQAKQEGQKLLSSI